MGLLDKLFNRQPKPGAPVEITDYEFEQFVLASDTPAVVNFYSISCSHCQVMGGLLREIGPNYTRRLNIFKMNVNENPETARMYQIQSVPTLVFFKNHRPRNTATGLIALNPLTQAIDELLE